MCTNEELNKLNARVQADPPGSERTVDVTYGPYIN
jgi:hypothetical protein